MAAPRFGPPGLAQVTSLVLMYGVIAMSRGIEPLNPDDMAL
jgi:hypothetical protein